MQQQVARKVTRILLRRWPTLQHRCSKDSTTTLTSSTNLSPAPLLEEGSTNTTSRSRMLQLGGWRDVRALFLPSGREKITKESSMHSSPHFCLNSNPSSSTSPILKSITSFRNFLFTATSVAVGGGGLFYTVVPPIGVSPDGGHYSVLVGPLIDRVQYLMKSKEWHFDYRRNNCLGYVRKYDQSDIYCVKTVGKIATSPDLLYDKVWNFGFKEWKAYYSLGKDGELLNWEVLENIDENTRIVYQSIQMEGVTLGKKPREYILLQHRYETTDSYHFYNNYNNNNNNNIKHIIFKSIDYNIPPLLSDSVRGEVSVGAYVFTSFPNTSTESGGDQSSSDTNQTLFAHLIHADPKGSTVPLIVNVDYQHIMDCPRRVEHIVGVEPPQRESWWKIVTGGRKEWETL